MHLSISERRLQSKLVHYIQRISMNRIMCVYMERIKYLYRRRSIKYMYRRRFTTAAIILIIWKLEEEEEEAGKPSL
jgi:hypothetical protein